MPDREQQIRKELAEIETRRRRLRKELRKGKGFTNVLHTYTRNRHEYLATLFEKTMRRMAIFRAAGGEVTWFNPPDPDTIEEMKPATCQGCVEPHLIGWEEGEWHHNCELKKKCDSVACALFVCHAFHVAFHNRIIKFIHREPLEVKP